MSFPRQANVSAYSVLPLTKRLFILIEVPCKRYLIKTASESRKEMSKAKQTEKWPHLCCLGCFELKLSFRLWFGGVPAKVREIHIKPPVGKLRTQEECPHARSCFLPLTKPVGLTWSPGPPAERGCVWWWWLRSSPRWSAKWHSKTLRDETKYREMRALKKTPPHQGRVPKPCSWVTRWASL